MRPPEAINPYAASLSVAHVSHGGDVWIRLARRLRWQVRALSVLWIAAAGVVLGEPLTLFSGTSLMDENASMLALLVCVLGGCVWFRRRWAIWLGTIATLVGVAHCTFRLRGVIAAYEVRLVAEVAELAIKTLLLSGAAFFASFLSGVYILWKIRMLHKAGIPYRFDPRLPQESYEYSGQRVDAVAVTKLAWRWDRLAWMWMTLAAVVVGMVFPCLLLLKEESYRITPAQWRIAIGLQVAALAAGLGLALIGCKVRRFSRTAAWTGLAISYALVAFGGLNLAAPRLVFPAFARDFSDMAPVLRSSSGRIHTGGPVAPGTVVGAKDTAPWAAGYDSVRALNTVGRLTPPAATTRN